MLGIEHHNRCRYAVFTGLYERWHCA